MRLDKFTVKAQEALQAAQSKADQHNHQAIEPEHLLSALLEQREGVVGPVLAKLGARPDSIQRELEAALGKLPAVKGGTGQASGVVKSSDQVPLDGETQRSFPSGDGTKGDDFILSFTIVIIG